MSASLVGSEMCIRDRPPPSQTTPNIASGMRAPEALVERLSGGSVGAVAVSYTHLTLPTICSV
eukprot:10532579-Alexandrium_andersonii.AAC.1